MILLIITSTILLLAFTGLCSLLCKRLDISFKDGNQYDIISNFYKFYSVDNRYQNRKALLRRRQVMFGNGTELTALGVVSDTMMTEFNPNYEFAGNLYSFKDLPQIPREYISLVKLVFHFAQ